MITKMRRAFQHRDAQQSISGPLRIRLPRLTLFGRSLLLISSELLANAVCWSVSAILFGRHPDTRPLLSLALLAWTIGLRHALDADHISAIDNATRSLMNLGQLPVTCGLFFSLGHSTIVILVNVAIAISTDVYDKIDGVGKVGGIVGDAVSASFLFIVGLANSIILWKILAKRRKQKNDRALRTANPEQYAEFVEEDDTSGGTTLMMRLIGPIVTFVNHPWKMYPVGVLFGFGFDTASSIALLAVTALARGEDGKQIPAGYIVILPLLFTVGMTLIDSLDSIIMLYSYAGFPERSFAIFEQQAPLEAKIPIIPSAGVPSVIEEAGGTMPYSEAEQPTKPPSVKHGIGEMPRASSTKLDGVHADVITIDPAQEQHEQTMRVKRSAMSDLSIVLTLMSILVAFSISLIVFMGLIGDNCNSCRAAANDPDGGELAGRWWRGWARANDISGYIGAAIVGCFVLVVSYWYGARYGWRKWAARRMSRGQ